MKTILTTERCKITEFTVDNFDDFLILNKDPVVMQHFLGGAKTDREAFTKFREILDTQERYGFSYWAVYDKRDNFLGQCGLLYNYDGSLNLCYAYHCKYQKKGIGTEVAKAILHYVFENFEVKNVVASSSLKNYPSMNLLEKLGFIPYKTGRVDDMDIKYYSLSKEDFHRKTGL